MSIRGTFKGKLLATFGAALLALLTVLVLSMFMATRVSRELDEVQGRLVPKAELGPRIEAELDHLTRSLQDAVAAQDPAGLEAAAERKTALFELIARAGPAVDPVSAASLRWAVQDYYDTARDVSRRMIAGESGEMLVQDVARMQAQQTKAIALVKKTTGVSRDQLSNAFGAVRAATERASRLRFWVTGLGGVLVAFIALWGGRGVLQALGDLSSGLARFGTGDFSAAIPVTTEDELGTIAKEANQMAASLGRLSEERERDSWLKSGLAKLSDQLRGDLEPSVVAERALGSLAQQVGALAGALYVKADDGGLELRATYASKPGADPGIPPRFEPGDGLIGEALESGELRVVADLPGDYLTIRSGLGEMRAHELVLLPLSHGARRVGALELALPEPLEKVARELLLSSRAVLVVALDAAHAGAARKRLLAETQAQAEQLTAQEEELRLNNQELLAQQEELRRVNEELEDQRQELRTHNTQLAEARSVLQQKAAELTQVSTYKSQFLANMSHELRTPLNSMLLLSQLLAENETGNLSAKQIEHLRTIHGAGHDLLSLINQVLDLSKIEAGKQELVLEAVEPGHFAAFAKRMFEQGMAQKGLQLVTQVDADVPAELVTDRQRIERILINLLGNALKFTERGQISLRIGRPSGVEQGVVSFWVSDTGVGIPEAARDRVFAPFEQVQGQTNRGHSGTGLGLSIARESARLLGGDLLLESSSSRGSTFVCTVPERAAAPVVSNAKPGQKVRDDAQSLAPGQPYLLIVEDDAVLAEQLVDIARARRLKAVVASTAREGLALARQGRAVGIVLDVKLPDLDGWAVMERLRRDPVTRQMPVHFVSGVDAPERGLALGAVGYLVKPASHSELASMVRALVPVRQNAQQILVVEDDADQGASVLALLEHAGFAARHVQTAQAALEALQSGQFGCMILDLGLPDMDGLGLLETMRQRPELSAPRVIIHTGRELSRRETRELSAYAEAVVLKDGSSAERLLEEVRLFIQHVTDRAQTKPAEPVQRVEVSLRGVKLLLAEDDMRTVYSLSALLRSKGADVVTAENGKEALEMLAAQPDIRGVLMDVMMPEMDGYEAIRQLRLDARFTKLPVIALTAKAMKGERERCLNAGASSYLPKPVDTDELLNTLQRVISAGKA